jgi:asparagine synthase (glutamine-hydrolysing)
LSVIGIVARWEREGVDEDAARRLMAPVRSWFSGEPRARRAPGAVLSIGDRRTSSGQTAPAPLVREESGFALVADIRFDDRQALRRELGGAGDDTDAGLVAAAYERWGAGLAGHLNGDFAVAVWDWRRGQVVATTDRLGVRPLVYRASPEGICLASDVEQVIAASDAPLNPDDEQVLDDLLWDYRSAERTFFADIRRVPAGHTLVASAGRLAVTRYWTPRPALLQLSSTAAFQERFRELFFQAVRRRLDSTDPVLMHLSGGLDSSSIVCVANAIGSELPAGRLRAVAAVHPGLACDEDPYIAAVERSISFPVERWDGLRSSFLDLDDPALAMPGARIVMNAGSRGDAEIAQRLRATVMLSGLGGDEVGTPLAVLHDLAASGNLTALAKETIFATDLPLRERLTRVKFVLKDLVPTPIVEILRPPRRAPSPPAWLGPVARELAARRSPIGPKQATNDFASRGQARRWESLTMPRLQVLLDAQQRYAREARFEFSYPFLDQDLIEFMLAVPVAHWPRPREYARFHRDALASLLPTEVTARRTKLVFLSGIVHKVRGAESRLRDLFGGSAWAAERYVDRRAAARLLDDVLRRGDESGAFLDWHAVWSIAILEAWLRRISEYSSPTRSD